MPTEFFQTVVSAAARSDQTIRELANAAGIPRSTLQDWITGKEPAAFAAFELLADSLGLSVQIATRVTPGAVKAVRKTRAKSS